MPRASEPIQSKDQLICLAMCRESASVNLIIELLTEHSNEEVRRLTAVHMLDMAQQLTPQWCNAHLSR